MGDSYRVTTVEINSSTYALIGTYASDGFTILNITIPRISNSCIQRNRKH